MSATPAQRALILTLLDERVVPASIKDNMLEVMGRADAMPRTHISPLIDGLMKLPKKADVAAEPDPTGLTGLAPASRRSTTMNDHLRSLSLPMARYAIPTEDLPAPTPGANIPRYAGSNSYLFVEAREYRETQYLRQMHGSPGDFSRTKFNLNEAYLIADLLATKPLIYTQTFGDIFTCCGKCGAPLTDDMSMLLKLGPTCRKEFGL